MGLFLWQYHTVSVTIALYYSLKPGSVIYPAFIYPDISRKKIYLLSQDCFDYLGSSAFPYKYYTYLF